MNRPAASLLCLLACSAVFNQVDANTKDEVKIEVVYRPDDCHRKSKRGDALNAHYDGYLAEDGSQIYCSREDNEGHPKWFLLGVGQVIKGLDIGMLDMCEGEKRKLIIPPSLAYGIIGKEEVYPTTSPMICKSIHACCKKRHSGLVRVECMYLFQYGKVPPNAILMFEVELYSVRNGPRSVESFNVIDLDGDRLLSQDELRSYVYEEFKRDNRIQDPTYKDKVLNDILRKNDHDGDGYISAREYNVFQHDEL